jgi:hypothetical protein
VVDQTRGYHGPRRAENLLLIDRARPAVPAIPAHGWRPGDRFTDGDPQLPRGSALFITGLKHDAVGQAVLRIDGSPAANAPGRCLELQSWRQPVDAELDRAIARGRDRVD